MGVRLVVLMLNEDDAAALGAHRTGERVDPADDAVRIVTRQLSFEEPNLHINHEKPDHLHLSVLNSLARGASPISLNPTRSCSDHRP
jgi:hypothetical protein